MKKKDTKKLTDKQKQQMMEKMEELCFGLDEDTEKKLHVIFDYLYDHKIVIDDLTNELLLNREMSLSERTVLLECTIGKLRGNPNKLNELYYRILERKQLGI